MFPAVSRKSVSFLGELFHLNPSSHTCFASSFFLIWTHGTPTVSCWIECPHKRPFSIATDRLLNRKKRRNRSWSLLSADVITLLLLLRAELKLHAVKFVAVISVLDTGSESITSGGFTRFSWMASSCRRQIFCVCVPAVKAMKQTASVQSLQSAQTAAVEQVTAFRP